MSLAEEISELSSRSANGVDVAILWRQRDDTAVIAVVDRRVADALFPDVHENDNALDMFHHPYAYAVNRRIDREPPGYVHAFQIAS